MLYGDSSGIAAFRHCLPSHSLLNEAREYILESAVCVIAVVEYTLALLGLSDVYEPCWKSPTLLYGPWRLHGGSRFVTGRCRQPLEITSIMFDAEDSMLASVVSSFPKIGRTTRAT